jgi:hypothetical protein
MGLPQPTDPIDDDARDENIERAPDRHAPLQPPDRPDWLVSAEDGLESEFARKRPEAGGERRKLEIKLSRPVAPDDEPQPMARPLPKPTLTRLPDVEPPVPMPSRGAPPVTAAPQSAGLQAWGAAASGVPRPRIEVAEEAVLPLAIEARPVPEGVESAFPDDEPAEADAGEAAVAAPKGGPGLREAWWLVALDALRSDRKVQLLAGLVVVLVAAGAFAFRGEPVIPLKKIRANPAQFDNSTVKVAGRVGEVFAVGGGYAFYLHQDRDTLVVFTRSRTPLMRENVTLRGSISTGFLDGQARQALFEE